MRPPFGGRPSVRAWWVLVSSFGFVEVVNRVLRTVWVNVNGRPRIAALTIGGFMYPPRDDNASIRQGTVNGRRRQRIVTRKSGSWVRQNYPTWTIIDSDDGISHQDGTSYLLEQEPTHVVEHRCNHAEELDHELADAVRVAVRHLVPILPLTGSPKQGYQAAPGCGARGSHAEWYRAAEAVAILHRVLKRQEDGST